MMMVIKLGGVGSGVERMSRVEGAGEGDEESSRCRE